MEPIASSHKSLERLISQKAMQMSSSTPCKMWLLGFFCGFCITYFFLVALTPFRPRAFGTPIPPQSSTLWPPDSNISESYSSGSHREIPASRNSSTNNHLKDDERVLMLYNTWTSLLNEADQERFLLGETSRDDVPRAPHLEDCQLNTQTNKRFDSYGENGSFPPWTLWRGLLGLELLQPLISEGAEKAHIDYRTNENGYPTWIVGSDEDNFPLTRKVQRDIWIHQHPQNCYDRNLRFLVADWEHVPGFGIGAQLAGMSGLLAIAIKERRILVTNYYNRADHDGCKGSSRSHWSCYFFSETSSECQNRAFDLLSSQEAWLNGTLTVKDNYTTKEIWAGRVPRAWGRPWAMLQPTTEVDGSLLRSHRKMDRRWWRAQAVRYLMRFQSEYTCRLLNAARHNAFGMQAAKMVIESLTTARPKVSTNTTGSSEADIEHLVWSIHKPWKPKPLLSIHVRMGDKACEMKVIAFENYMLLADKIRQRFPNLNNIWLSTEMQQVIDATRVYHQWNFYYTKVTRQVGNMSMAKYEASLGRETSTNYPLVNFIMATEADFFIGALGSTWCYLIDGMRNTGGKVMAGYVSVNKDRFW